jgi:hypothetical protein
MKPTAMPSWSRRDLAELGAFAFAIWTIIVLSIVGLWVRL